MPYVIYGYIYLTTYYWITFKDNTNFNNLFIKSVAVSFILKTIFEVITYRFNINFQSNILKTFMFVFASACLGLIIGKITVHKYFNLLLHKMHIGRTTNTNIWDDVIKPYTWVRVFMKDGSSYLGQYRYGEPFKSEPIIVLATYQKLDEDTDVVIDNSKNINEFIMINTKDFDRIEITYHDLHKQSFVSKIQQYIRNILRIR